MFLAYLVKGLNHTNLLALTQPEVKIILQVSWALFDGVEDQIGVAGVESPDQVLWHGHQVKVLHSPHLEAMFLPGPFELWVMCCHVVREGRLLVRCLFAMENGTFPAGGKWLMWRQSPTHWCSVCFPPNEEEEEEEEDVLVVNQRFVSPPAVSESLNFARRKLVSAKQQLWDTDNGYRKQLWVLSCPPGVSASGI